MSSTTVELQGHVEPGFEPVREAFAANFSERGEVGASLALMVDGRMAVDLWGGWCDAERTRPWERDTIVNTYSTTKGIAAACAAILADRGQLDVEAPVVRYWPEFGQASKEGIPVKWLFTHQAGLPVIDEELPPGGVLDWETMVHALERQAPVWEPGTQMGYHALTYAWLVGEVIRRVAGKSVGAFLREELAGPLDADYFIGTPASEDHRIADMLTAAPGQAPLSGMQPGSLAARALGMAGPPVGAGVNTREWRAAEIPSANGHGNGRALARIYGALARGGELDGVRVVSPAAIERFATEEVSAHDVVIDIDARRGLGFILSTPGGRYDWGPNLRTFGHSGAGGSLGFADPDARIGFGYAMNQMASGLSADPRWKPMIDAVYGCL